MKFQRRNCAISQIMGTTLLLLIALSILSIIYLYVLSYPTPIPIPQVEIVGSLEDGNIVLLHGGGDALKLDTKLLFNINDTIYITNVGDNLDNKSKQNRAWDISEQIIYVPPIDITNLHVDATLIDKESDTVLMMIVLQE